MVSFAFGLSRRARRSPQIDDPRMRQPPALKQQHTPVRIGLASSAYDTSMAARALIMATRRVNRVTCSSPKGWWRRMEH
jgi:hypothetical protein